MSTTPVTLSIAGMTCGHCVAAVQEALEGVPGLAASRVAIGSAQLDAGSDAVVRDAVRAIADAGYAATVGDASSAPPAAAASCCAAPKPQPLSRG